MDAIQTFTLPIISVLRVYTIWKHSLFFFLSTVLKPFFAFHAYDINCQPLGYPKPSLKPFPWPCHSSTYLLYKHASLISNLNRSLSIYGIS